MTTIRQLSVEDTLSAGDSVPFSPSSSGDARRFPLSTLVEYLSTAFSSLTVSSYVKTSAVAVSALPSAATAGNGARAMVSDATATTFNSTVAGGGVNIVPVFSDGTVWRIG